LVLQVTTGLGPNGLVSATTRIELTDAGRRALATRLAMVLGNGVALKGCAARTGKPASALDRDTAAKRIVVMPLSGIAGSRKFMVDRCALHVRTLLYICWRAKGCERWSWEHDFSSFLSSSDAADRLRRVMVTNF
jgi:hypothetical protein